MTHKEWLECHYPRPMLEGAQGVDQCEGFVDGNDPRPILPGSLLTFSERKLRLYAVACCRHSWTAFTDERCRKAVDVGEQFANGTATSEQLARAANAAHSIRPHSHPPP